MKKIAIYIVLATLCSKLAVNAQEKPTITTLKIGDSVPNITINNIVNYKSAASKPAAAKIADFKGKLLILDFWATWCSSCISTFPELYDLQKEFKGQIQVLLVNTKDTRDDKLKVEAFFTKRKGLYQLPSVIYDTTLKVLFPHKSIPHSVWIMNNKVAAITSAEDVNQENIQAILTNGKINLYAKNDIDYNFLKPLFIEGNGGTPPGYIFRSVLTGYVRGLRSSLGVISHNDKIAARIYQTNTSILNLYQQAYREYRNFKRNQIIFDVSNPTDFSADSNSYSWNSKHLYNYELTFPPQLIDSALKLMQDDLRRYFDLTVHIENRQAPCFVLKKVGSLKHEAPDSFEPETNIDEKDNKPKYFRNYPLTALIDQMNDVLKIPLIDETGFGGKLNVNLPADLTNEDLLKRSFKEQGFILNKEKRELSFLVFSATPVAGISH
ncbi:soil-associated protein, TIGR03435 family [Mucilaginibacter pineti]|uniref:Soil-associated protein, TIGR03435 family n=1 Tax=Mucilaginibacter pineti TaxID=1391627 RepID=A0A1G7HD20_9SPHI|nr:redoxin family protein [Mucilaginibacter pineti]SDE97959.1 soil-associated protein, TIGR03435 family [Mucilaginibacter pineti]